MNIRPLCSEDALLLEELLYLALWQPEGQLPFPREITRSPELRRYISEWGELPGDTGFVGENSPGLPLGAVWLRLIPPPGGYGFWNPWTPELSMAVFPAARNQGLGTQLLATAITNARGSFPSISLSVAPDNPARRLYKRFEFQEREQRGESIVMVRTFEPSEQNAS